MHCFYSQKLLKYKEFKHQKEFEAKKTHSPTTNSSSRNGGQYGQALRLYYKKDFCSNKECQQGQSFNIPAIDNNATIVKKDKKQAPKQNGKKHVLVLKIYASMTEAGKKVDPKVQEGYELQQTPYIYYFTQFVQFRKEIGPPHLSNKYRC